MNISIRKELTFVARNVLPQDPTLHIDIKNLYCWTTEIGRSLILLDIFVAFILFLKNGIQ